MVRRVETESPAFTYPAALEIADFGMAQASIRIRVRQMGRAVPLGVAAEADLTL